MVGEVKKYCLQFKPILTQRDLFYGAGTHLPVSDSVFDVDDVSKG